MTTNATDTVSITTEKPKKPKKNLAQWWFGGISCAIAIIITHPIDLVKVRLQTQQGEKKSIIGIIKDIWRTGGIFGFYSGVTSGVIRQLVYSTTRFAIYEFFKETFPTTIFVLRVLKASIAGGIGGFVGAPFDLITVRMQNDKKLPEEERRNYKNPIHALIRIVIDEGPLKIFSGAVMTVFRASVLAGSQLAVYDQLHYLFVDYGEILVDDHPAHLLCGFLSGITTTLATHPVDVVKTRMMSSNPRPFTGIFDCFKFTYTDGGFLAFYKGIGPAFFRIVPNNIIVYFIYETLISHIGRPAEKKTTSAPSTESTKSTTNEE